MKGISNIPQKAEEATSWPSKVSLQIESILDFGKKMCFWPPIVNPGVDSKRSCCYSTDGAQEEDDLVSPLEPGHGVGVHGVADGQVPLEWEGKDGQNTAVRGPSIMFDCKKRYVCNKTDISAMNALSLQTVSPNTQGYCCQYTDRSKDAPKH